MQFEEKAQILEAFTKEFPTDDGVRKYSRVRLNIGGEIYACKCTESQVSALESLAKVKAFGRAVVSVNSPKEKLEINLVSFE